MILFKILVGWLLVSVVMLVFLFGAAIWKHWGHLTW